MLDLSYCDINGNIEQEQETANSYVIHEPGDYCFPLVYGNSIKHGKDNPSSFVNFEKVGQKDFYNYLYIPIDGPELPSEPRTAEILVWDSSREFIKNLKIKDTYLYFSVLYIPDSGSNYIIAVRDKDGDIMWSWHIWLWKNKFKDIKVGKYFILSENLATKGNRSWYYQWGRKDPFLYFNRRFLFASPEEYKISEFIKNPNIFYISTTFLRLGTNYWNAIQDKKTDKIYGVVKTVYDPCPRSYNVPRRDILFIPNVTYDKSLYEEGIRKIMPLCGYRNAAMGDLNDGEIGVYWTSGIFREEFCDIQISSGNIDPDAFNCNYFGFSIRPQREEILNIDDLYNETENWLY